jgi:hypothetical protein
MNKLFVSFVLIFILGLAIGFILMKYLSKDKIIVQGVGKQNKIVHHNMDDKGLHVGCCLITEVKAKSIIMNELKAPTIERIKRWLGEETVTSVEYVKSSTNGCEHEFILFINQNDKKLLKIIMDHLSGSIQNATGYQASLSRKEASDKALKAFEEKTNEYIKKNGPDNWKDLEIVAIGFSDSSNNWFVGLKQKGKDTAKCGSWSVFFDESGNIRDVWLCMP